MLWLILARVRRVERHPHERGTCREKYIRWGKQRLQDDAGLRTHRGPSAGGLQRAPSSLCRGSFPQAYQRLRPCKALNPMQRTLGLGWPADERSASLPRSPRTLGHGKSISSTPASNIRMKLCRLSWRESIVAEVASPSGCRRRRLNGDRSGRRHGRSRLACAATTSDDAHAMALRPRLDFLHLMETQGSVHHPGPPAPKLAACGPRNLQPAGAEHARCGSAQGSWAGSDLLNTELVTGRVGMPLTAEIKGEQPLVAWTKGT